MAEFNNSFRYELLQKRSLLHCLAKTESVQQYYTIIISMYKIFQRFFSLFLCLVLCFVFFVRRVLCGCATVLLRYCSVHAYCHVKE